MRYHTRLSLNAVLVLSLFVASCGGSGRLLQGLRASLAASDPLVQSLVDTGAIQSTQATAISRDFADAVGCASDLQADFDLIQDKEPDAKSRKLNASVTAARCWKTIVERQNFAAHPRIQRVSAIADGIFAALVVFYSEPGTMRASAAAASTTSAPLNEKELERDLERRMKELKTAAKPVDQ